MDENFIGPPSLYGLDSDKRPQYPDLVHNDQMTGTSSPQPWDAFSINTRDYASVNIRNIITLNTYASQLASRLEQLIFWLMEVLDQLAALCWAAFAFSLNHIVIDIISRELLYHSRPIHPLILQRWQVLIEEWKINTYFSYDLVSLPKKDKDWDATVIEQFEKLTRPHLFIKSSVYLQPIPQKLKLNRKNIDQFAPVDIKYPHFDQPIVIPDKWCSASLKALRRNLEIAISCEKEIGVYGGIVLQPIICVNGSDNDIERTHHLSGMIIYFAKLFDQLCKIDPSAAKFEFLSWPRNDDIVFAHLRIWAAGKPEIVADDEFGQFISSLSDETIGNCQHEDDLLTILTKRWVKLDNSTRSMIETRLLENTPHFTGKDQLIRKNRQTWLRLNRLQHFIDNGCELSPATQKKAQKLRSIASDWTEEQARNATRRITREFVATNTDYAALLNIPLSELLPEADRIQQNWDDIRTVNRPFEGLVLNKPVLAFSALRFEAKKGIFQPWAWETFFYSNARKEDQNRFKLLIANRLLNYPDEQITIIIKSVGYWLYDNAAKLEKNCLPVFVRLANRLVEILRMQPDKGKSSIKLSIDKFNEAINAPAGMMARALLTEPFKQNLNNKHFHKEWFGLIESLLKLPDVSRQYVLVMLFREIDWFFQTDKDWTKKYLLPIFHSSNSIARDAAWSGFLEAHVLPCLDIFKNIKDDLLTIVKTRPSFYFKYIYQFVGFILKLWDKTDKTIGERRIADEELKKLLLKSDDRFRIVILDHLKLKILNKNVFPNQWKSRLPELFAIWPKQMKAWSPEVSAGFFNLLIWSGEQFPVLLNLVINRLNKVYDLRSANLYSLTVSGFGNTIIQDYPKELLELLFTVLPNDARQWSFIMDIILQKIVETDSSLKKDKRYIELKRRYSI